MNSKCIGNLGEAKALARLVELGIPVYQQFGDNECADLIIIVNNTPLKVQVKTSTKGDEDKVRFSLTSSTSHRKNGSRHKYSVDEVDIFICLDAKKDILFVIKNIGNMSRFDIRYASAKNNQEVQVHYFEDYILCIDTLQDAIKAE